MNYLPVIQLGYRPLLVSSQSPLPSSLPASAESLPNFTDIVLYKLVPCSCILRLQGTSANVEFVQHLLKAEGRCQPPAFIYGEDTCSPIPSQGLAKRSPPSSSAHCKASPTPQLLFALSFGLPVLLDFFKTPWSLLDHPQALLSLNHVQSVPQAL